MELEPFVFSFATCVGGKHSGRISLNMPISLLTHLNIKKQVGRLKANAVYKKLAAGTAVTPLNAQ